MINQQCASCKRRLTPDCFNGLKTCTQCRERARLWRESNKKRNDANKRRWDLENRDRVRAAKQRWNLANRDYFREYHEVNREEKIAAAKRWKIEHPERARLNSIVGCQRRRARRKGATVEVFTFDELRNYWVAQGINPDACAYCGGPHEHDDHVIALSRGGTHERANLLPACESCNLSKGVKLLHEWQPERFAA